MLSEPENVYVLNCCKLLCQKMQSFLSVAEVSRQLPRVWERKLYGNSKVVVAGIRKEQKRKETCVREASEQIFSTKSAKRTIRLRRDILLKFLIDHVKQTLVSVFGNLGVDVWVVDDILSSPEQKFFPLPHWTKTAENLIPKRVVTITLI